MKHHHGRSGKRLFDYGELKILLVAMLAQRPSHGYELIKAIEERMQGRYTPSPGVIYPTLAWLDDMGYALVEAAIGGRKRYRLTPEGEAFFTANRSAAEELLSRSAPSENNGEPIPDALVKSMAKLSRAIRLRTRRGPLDEMTAKKIAELIDAATNELEQT